MVYHLSHAPQNSPPLVSLFAPMKCLCTKGRKITPEEGARNQKVNKERKQETKRPRYDIHMNQDKKESMKRLDNKFFLPLYKKKEINKERKSFPPSLILRGDKT